LKEAEKFHGHLGPYLVLGILAGELAINKLRCKKYFGLDVKVWGATQKPKSCLIDGLQLSTGSTYGKGNIKKINGSKIKIDFCNLVNHKKITLKLKDNFIQRLQRTKTHKDSEALARQLYNTDPLELFSLTTLY
jgi:formylmethanofuran dehydrogenase subunit E